jgi:hypothetical protein
MYGIGGNKLGCASYRMGGSRRLRRTGKTPSLKADYFSLMESCLDHSRYPFHTHDARHALSTARCTTSSYACSAYALRVSGKDRMATRGVLMTDSYAVVSFLSYRYYTSYEYYVLAEVSPHTNPNTPLPCPHLFHFLLHLAYIFIICIQASRSRHQSSELTLHRQHTRQSPCPLSSCSLWN